MSADDGFGAEYAAEQLRRARHPLRRIIKTFYLRNVLQDIRGAAIDFGCGAGQLLSRLPPGSIGLEVNPYLVNALNATALPVELYDPDTDGFSLTTLSSGAYETLILSHVLEHFSEASDVLRRLFLASKRLGIQRVLLIVPGFKGFQSDPTHKTFITRAYLTAEGLDYAEGYSLTRSSCFPLNLPALGTYFTYHELKLIYDRLP